MAADVGCGREAVTGFLRRRDLMTLMKRPVLFYLYKRDPSDMKLFLTVTDVEGVSKVRVDVFGQYFPDADARQNATAGVGAVVEQCPDGSENNMRRPRLLLACHFLIARTLSGGMAKSQFG